MAAVLAADVSGYSRLMGLDEVGTARTLREHRGVTDKLVTKHGGRIVKTTGDGVLLEFPSVVDAVECAVAVQAVMVERNQGISPDRQMLFRIGINLGDILIEGNDILGDGVNVAARLEGIAEPGGVCISASAYDQVRDKVAVQFRDDGEQQLKNISLCCRSGFSQRRSKQQVVRSAARWTLTIICCEANTAIIWKQLTPTAKQSRTSIARSTSIRALHQPTHGRHVRLVKHGTTNFVLVPRNSFRE